MAGARKTYWHLAGAKRRPSDYEIATSRLLTHVERGGLAIELPTSAFVARHRSASPLCSERWEEFADPRATTYTKYVDLARDRESYVGKLLASIEESDYDRKLGAAWVDTLARVLSPLRFLGHGLQMAAAYVGQTAPASRIAVAGLFQCGDELRRVQRLAFRIAQLARLRPEIGEGGRAAWQSEPAWQPLRRIVERLLVTYDWGEALVALNVCVKPVVDDLFLLGLAAAAERAGDHVDAQILRSLFEDCAWHQAWSRALLALAEAERPANKEIVAGWIAAWSPAVEDARAAAATLVEAREGAGAPAGPPRLRSPRAPAESAGGSGG